MVGGVLSYSASAAAGLAVQHRQAGGVQGANASVFKPTTAAASSAAAASGDSVTLSGAAKALAGLSRAPAAYYQEFMPVRDGFSSAALAEGVTDPGAESFSAGKTTAEVGSAARAELDKEYAAMQASGAPFNFDSPEGKDWYTLFGQLDRRALVAVRNNEGGQFTQQERDIATSIMSQQQGLAMGLYNGPTRLEGNFVDPYAGDEAKRQLANIAFLDAGSDDEKATLPWATARASAQTAEKWDMEAAGADMSAFSKFEGESPLVKLIAAAMDTMRRGGARGHTNGSIKTADDLKRQPWFEGFEGQLDQAIARSNALYRAPGAQAG